MTREGRAPEVGGKLAAGPLIVAGLALVAAGSALALSARGAGLLTGDLALARSLQHPEREGIAGSLLMAVGDAAWLLTPLVVVFSLLMRRWLDALSLFFAGLTGALVGDVLLKALVRRPRPASEIVRISGTPEGYSFPSGTVFLTTVVLGSTCYLVWRARPPRFVVAGTLGVALVLVSLVGLSRVYSGEHWSTDVLGGWLLGGAWTVVLVGAHSRWLSGRTGDSGAEGSTRRRTRGRR